MLTFICRDSLNKSANYILGKRTWISIELSRILLQRKLEFIGMIWNYFYRATIEILGSTYRIFFSVKHTDKTLKLRFMDSKELKTCSFRKIQFQKVGSRSIVFLPNVFKRKLKCFQSYFNLHTVCTNQFKVLRY